ncbi:MAG: aminoacyl-tRNA hydrolase [Microthrixaceae bacterium]|nr:aminoacyl-tRNA hydrolase [Microthrixaceae bacterium]
MVEPGEDLRLGRIVIPASELEWRFSSSGGPGGQHANTSNTRAEVAFDIAGSPSLSPTIRERLVAKLGQEVAVTSSEHRSQYQNRRAALQRLEAVLRSALVVPRKRVATRPTLGSQERRLDDKRQQSDRKAARRRPVRGDD